MGGTLCELLKMHFFKRVLIRNRSFGKFFFQDQQFISHLLDGIIEHHGKHLLASASSHELQ